MISRNIKYLIALCLQIIHSDCASAVRKKGSCDKDTEIECDYFQSKILLDSGHQDMHRCKSNDVSYQIDFTEDVVSSNQLKSGEVKLCILKDAMGSILSLDDFKFIDVPHVMNGSTHAMIGTRKVLVLRVKATDTETKHSPSELSAKIFGGGKDRLNMGSQFIACSLGQLKFEAFAGSTEKGAKVVKGVGTINIAIAIKGSQYEDVEVAIKKAAEDKYGKLSSQFNHVMFCIPSGSKFGVSTTWIALAETNSWYSVYNGENCIYPSAQMHEIGHNLNLGHSGEADSSYGDGSCLMGEIRPGDEEPRMCFNGAKSFQLGWYEDGHKVVKPLKKSYYGEIVGFVDHKERGGKNTIIKIEGHNIGVEYYVHFNRKSGFNADTQEGDSVMITSRPEGSGLEQSWLVAKLENDYDKYLIPSFGGGPDCIIELEHIALTESIPFAKIKIQTKECKSGRDCNDGNYCTLDRCIDEHCYFEEVCNICTNITVDVTTDDGPKETKWKIENTDSKKTIHGGPYKDKSKLYNSTHCLAVGNYKFTMLDSMNNGLNGTGSYKLSLDNGGILKKGSKFLYLEEHYFSTCKYDSDCNDFNPATFDRCNLVTNLCSFKECPDCGVNISVALTVDLYPEETKWKLVNVDTKKVVMSGGPYADGRHGRKKKSLNRISRRLSKLQQYKQEKILGVGKYLFTIEDSYGNGVCCNDGSGDFAVTTPTTVIAQGVAFSSKYEIPFSICSSDSHCDDKNDCTYDRCNTTNQLCLNEPMPCTECGKVLTVDIVTDEYPDESTWYLKNDLSTISFNDGPYEKDYTLYQREMCLPYGSYNFTMIDSYGDGFGFSSNDGDDANDDYYDDDWYNYDDDNATDSRRLQGINVINKTKGYALILQNEVIKRGGDFHYTEETLFTICSKDEECNDNNICTDDSCNSTSNLCMFDPKPCHECGSLLNLTILPDKWPQDITWTIQDIVTDETILSGGPYEQKGLQQTTECLEFGSYLFSIFDSYGDGLCCDEGSGYYQLSLGSKVVKRGGNYSAFEEKSFHVCSSDSDCAVDNSCIASTCDLNSNVCIEKRKSCSECGSKVSIEVRTDGYPSETYWAIANSRNEEVLSGGPYNISNGFNKQSTCLEFGSYHFSIFDYDGICCNGDDDGDDDGGDGNYAVKLNDKALRTGGEFEMVEFTPFVICNIDAECNDQNECTEDVCDQEMRACVYNTKPCSECGVNVSVDVLTDDYPDEISWKILDEDTEQVIMIGGPYNENDTSKLFQHSSCLPCDNYIFVAHDEYGDGFEGEGYYKLKIDDKVMKQSGSNYSVEEESFRICSSDIHCSNANSCLISTCDKGTNTCVEHTSCSHCGANISVDILTDKRPIDTTWKIKSMNLNQTILAGGPYSLTDLYRTETCLEFGDYLFTIHDKYGDGICCDSGFGNYNLTIQDKVVFNGGNFGESDEVKFTVCSSDTDCNDNDNCTSDRCSESNACVYEQKLCSECGSEAVVDFSKFDYSFNSAWEIRNKNGAIFMSGGPYNTVKEVHNESKCLEVGEYSFAIANGWEDTSCCATSNGTYSVTIDSEVVQYGKELDPPSTKTFRVSMSTNSSDEASSTEPSISISTTPSTSLATSPSIMLTTAPSLFPSTIDPTAKLSLNPSPLPSYSPSNIPTDISTKNNSKCAKESKRAKECGAKGGQNACCPGLVCHHHQYWRCVQEKHKLCSGPYAFSKSCGSKYENAAPACCPGLTCAGKKCIAKEQTTCAEENERSRYCGADYGEDMCCNGLVCHVYQSWRCVQEKNKECAGPGTYAKQCGSYYKKAPPECCAGLTCHDKKCVIS